MDRQTVHLLPFNDLPNTQFMSQGVRWSHLPTTGIKLHRTLLKFQAFCPLNPIASCLLLQAEKASCRL